MRIQQAAPTGQSQSLKPNQEQASHSGDSGGRHEMTWQNICSGHIVGTTCCCIHPLPPICQVIFIQPVGLLTRMMLLVLTQSKQTDCKPKLSSSLLQSSAKNRCFHTSRILFLRIVLMCYCAVVRAHISVLHQWQPKLQFALHVFSPQPWSTRWRCASRSAKDTEHWRAITAPATLVSLCRLSVRS